MILLDKAKGTCPNKEGVAGVGVESGVGLWRARIEECEYLMRT